MKPWIRRSLALIGVTLLLRILARIEWERFFLHLESIPIPTLLMALVCAALGLWIKSLRWHLCFYGERLEWKGSLRAFFASVFLGLITPARAGELLRVEFLRQQGITTFRATGLLIHDRFFDFGILFAGFLTAFLAGSSQGLLLGLMLLFGLHYRVVRKLEIVGQHWFVHILQYGLSFLCYAVYGYGFFRILAILFEGIQFKMVLPAVLSANLIAWIPVSWQGLGTKEQVYLSLLPGLEVEALIAASLLHFVLTLLASLLASGLPLLFLGITQTPTKN